MYFICTLKVYIELSRILVTLHTGLNNSRGYVTIDWITQLNPIKQSIAMYNSHSFIYQHKN